MLKELQNKLIFSFNEGLSIKQLVSLYNVCEGITLKASKGNLKYYKGNYSKLDEVIIKNGLYTIIKRYKKGE